MPHRDITVIGTSTGGVTTLSELCADLPESFPAAIFVVLHTGARPTNLR